jgi:methylmalonyl-CoA mutase
MEDALTSRRRAIATRRDPVTGVSAFPNLDEQPLSRKALDVRALRVRLRESLSARRSPHPELDRLRMAANGESRDGMVTVAAVDALAAGATLAEAADSMRGGGEPTRCEALPQDRESEIFERLRDAADAWLADTGRRPRVFLAEVGGPEEHRRVREFAVNLLAAGGIETVSSEGADDVGAIASDFESSGTRTAVIVANPKRTGEVVPGLACALKERGALRVLVAARPGETEGEWRAAGVDGFLCEGCDVHRTLHDVLAASGWLS